MDTKTVLHVAGIIILGLLGLLYGIWSHGFEGLVSEVKWLKERNHFIEARQTEIEWQHRAYQEKTDELRLEVNKLKEAKR